MRWNVNIRCQFGTGHLIGYWMDLAGYYQIGETVYAMNGNGQLTNHGDAKIFIDKLAAGKWRGKLV